MKYNNTLKKIGFLIIGLLLTASAVFAGAANEQISEIQSISASAATNPSFPALNTSDSNAASYWQLKADKTDGWIEYTLTDLQYIYGITLHADLHSGSELVIEYKSGETWIPFTGGTFLAPANGTKSINSFYDLSMDQAFTGLVRLRLLDSTVVPCRVYGVEIRGETDPGLPEKLTNFTSRENYFPGFIEGSENLFDSSVWTEWKPSGFVIPEWLRPLAEKIIQRFRGHNLWMLDNDIDIEDFYSFNGIYNLLDDYDDDKKQSKSSRKYNNHSKDDDDRDDEDENNEYGNNWNIDFDDFEEGIRKFGNRFGRNRERSQSYSIYVTFETPVELQKTMFFLSEAYFGELEISAETIAGTETIAFITGDFTAGWNVVPVSLSEAVQNITITQSAYGKQLQGIAEVEFWGHGNPLHSSKADLSYPGVINSNGELIQLFDVNTITASELSISLLNSSLSEIPVSWNGETKTALKTAEINGTAVYTLQLSPVELMQGDNVLEAVLRDSEYFVKAELDQTVSQGLLSFAPNSLNDGILFENQTSETEYILNLSDSALVHSVYLYGENSSSAAVSAWDGFAWIPLIFARTTNTGSEFFGSIGTTQIKIETNGSAVNEALVFASPLYTSAPKLTIIWPESESILSKGMLKAGYIFGSVDNPEAVVTVNGKAAQRHNEWFWLKLRELNLDETGAHIVTVQAAANDAVTEQQIIVNNGIKLKYSLNDEGRTVVTTKTPYVIEGNANNNLLVYINGVKATRNKKIINHPVDLEPGLNIIPVEIKKRGNKKVLKRLFLRIVYIHHDLALEIESPGDGSYLSETSVQIKGRIHGSGDLTVTVNEIPASIIRGQFTSAPVVLTNGINTITVTASDETGEVLSKELTLIIDNEAPVLTETLPNPESGYVTTNPVTISGTFTDDSDVSVWINGYAAIIEDNTYTINLAYFDGLDKSYTITAKDGAGNEISDTITFRKDTTAPLPFDVIINPDGWTNVMPEISFSTTDETSGIHHYEISIGGLPFVEVTSSYTPTYTYDDEFSIVIQAVDNVGWVTIAEGIMKIDTAPPESPAMFRGVPSKDDITLKWIDAVEEKDPRYEITREPAFAEPVITTETSYLDLDVESGTLYIYSITTIDKADNHSEVPEVCEEAMGLKMVELSTEEPTAVEYDTLALILPTHTNPDSAAPIIMASTISSPEMEATAFQEIIGDIIDINILTKTDGNNYEYANHVALDEKFIGTFRYEETDLPEGFKEQNLGVYYFDPQWNRWFLIPEAAVDTENNMIIFTADHFSSFSVQPTTIQDLSPQELSDSGKNPFQTLVNHGEITVSPQGGSVNSDATEFVLPGKNGFNFELKRTFDSATAREDSLGTTIAASMSLTPRNLAILLNDTVGSDLDKAILEYAKDQAIGSVGDSIVSGILGKIEEMIKYNGDFGYSMGLGWRLNLPYIKHNNSSVMIRTPQGGFYQLNKMECTDYKYGPLTIVRELTFENHVSSDFTLIIRQSRINFDISDIGSSAIEILKNINNIGKIENIISGQALRTVLSWNLINASLIMKDGTTYNFDARGRVTEIISPTGLDTVDINYDGAKIDTITDSMGRILDFTYEETPFCRPIIKRIQYRDDTEYQRKVTYTQTSPMQAIEGIFDSDKPQTNALLSAVVSIADPNDPSGTGTIEREYNYTYEKKVLASGNLGVKINAIAVIELLLTGSSVISETLGIGSAITLHGALTVELPNQLKTVSGPGIGFTSIDYKYKTIPYFTITLGDYIFGIIPTALDISGHIAKRILAERVTVTDATAGENNTPQTKVTTYQYDLVPDVFRNQIVNVKTVMDDGKQKNVFTYDSSLIVHKTYYSDLDYYTDLAVGLIQGSFIQSESILQVVRMPYNTKIQLYDSQTNDLLETTDFTWNVSRMRMLSQTVSRGPNFVKSTDLTYDNWGNVIHQVETQQAEARTTVSESWSVFNNTYAPSSAAFPWDNNEIAEDADVQGTLNYALPIRTVQRITNPVDDSFRDVQTDYDFNSRGQLLNQTVDLDQALDSVNSTEDAISTYVYDETADSPSNGMITRTISPEGLITDIEYLYLDNDAYAYYLVKSTVNNVEQWNDSFTGDPDFVDLVTYTAVEKSSGWSIIAVDPRGYATALEYDGFGRVVKTYSPADDSIVFTQASFTENVMNTITNDSNHWISNEIIYDDEALTSTIIPRQGGLAAQAVFQYTSKGRLSTISKHLRTLNAQKILVDTDEIITTALTYDQYGNITSVTKPSVNDDESKTEFTYDSFGGVKTLTHPETDGSPAAALNTETDYSIGKRSVTNERNHKSYSYSDWNGQVYKSEVPVGANTIISEIWYDSAGNPVKQTVPEFNTTSQSASITRYNIFGKPVMIFNPSDEFHTYSASLNLEKFTGTPYVEYVYNRTGSVVEEQIGYFRGTNKIYLLKKVQTVNKLGQVIAVDYYEAESPGSWKSTPEYTEKIRYDKNGNVTASSDGMEKISRLTYSARNLKLTETAPLVGTDPLAQTITYTYDDNGNQASLTDPRHSSSDFQITYLYDDLNRLILANLPDSPSSDGKPLMQFIYTDRNKLEQQINPDGTTTSYTYNARDFVIEEKISAQGTSIEYSTFYRYDKIGNVVEQYQEEEKKTLITYDELNQVIKTTHPLKNFEKFGYDALGNQTAVYDGNTNPVFMKYNLAGKVTKQIDADEKEAEYFYNVLGNAIAYEDKNENRYKYVFDSFGRLIDEYDAFGGKTHYEYNKVGNVHSIINPNNITAEYTYTENHLVKSINYSGAQSHQITYWYDVMGSMRAVKDGDVTSFINSHSDLDIENASFDDILAEFKADPYERVFSRITRINDSDLETAKTTEVQYSFDEMDRLTELVYPDNYSVNYDYNSFGQLVDVSGNKPSETVYSFIPDNGISYDSLGRLESIQAGNGITNSFTYDDNSRLKNLNYTSSTEEILKSFSFTYDDANNILTKNASVYQYDDVNRLKQGDLVGLFEVNVMEKADQNVGIAKKDYKGKKSLDFDINNIETVYLDNQAISIGVNLGKNYHVSRIYINSESVEHRTLDGELELYFTTETESSWQKLDESEWLLKEADEGDYYILLRIPLVANKVKIHCNYNELNEANDSDNRFAGVGNNISSIVKVYYMEEKMFESYKYDNNGNRTEFNQRIGNDNADLISKGYYYYPTGQTDSEGSERLKTDATWMYEYDKAGNLKYKGTYSGKEEYAVFDNDIKWLYEYDVLNRLVSVFDKDNKLLVSYTYDANGYRVKTNSEKYGITFYAFSENGYLLYTEKHGDEIGEVFAVSTQLYVLNKHFARRDYENDNPAKENIYYYLTDQLGSTVMTTDKDGRVLWQDDYTPFGDSAGKVGLLDETGKYTGKEIDPDTGFYYSNARWYDSSLGRFITEDPIKDGLNWYGYVSNNPLIFIDPTGLWTDYSDQTAAPVQRKDVDLTPITEYNNYVYDGIPRRTGADKNNNYIPDFIEKTGDYAWIPVVPSMTTIVKKEEKPQIMTFEEWIQVGPGEVEGYIIYLATQGIFVSNGEENENPIDAGYANFGQGASRRAGWYYENGEIGKGILTNLVGVIDIIDSLVLSWFGAQVVGVGVSTVEGVLSGKTSQGINALAGNAANRLKSSIPSVKELRVFNSAGSGLQTHHLLPEYLGKLLGYTSSQMVNQPGILIAQFTHTGASNPSAFHKVISSYLPVGGNYTAAQISQGLSSAYSELGRPELFNVISSLIK